MLFASAMREVLGAGRGEAYRQARLGDTGDGGRDAKRGWEQQGDEEGDGGGDGLQDSERVGLCNTY